MNREILFRGRGYKSGEWYYGDLLKRRIEGTNAYLFSIVEAGPVESFEKDKYRYTGKDSSHIVTAESIGQYTGMNDITGEKIFEGDYVKRTDIAVLGGTGELYGTVIFLEGQWWIKPDKNWPVPLFDTEAEVKILE